MARSLDRRAFSSITALSFFVSWLSRLNRFRGFRVVSLNLSAGWR